MDSSQTQFYVILNFISVYPLAFALTAKTIFEFILDWGKDSKKKKKMRS